MNAIHWLPTLGLLAAVAAQRSVDPDEFVRLEPVLQHALAAAAPFVVTVETFGGTRRTLGADGAVDGDAPPAPRPPKPKPEPKPDPEPAPDGPDKPGEPTPMPPEKPGAEKKKLPLVAPGFQQTQGKTSGVVLTADGWILVSRFALNLDPTTILITVPGRGTFHAERGGEDTSRGIALVKIEAHDLPVPEFVPPEAVRVGQWAFVLGRTFAVDEPTVHIGIVSAQRRLFGRALQIDAYTSPANYGGAVVDVHGHVLGIAVPLSPSGRNAGVEWYDSGIGFAVTLANIPDLLARMQQGQVLQRGWLGVQFETAFLGPGAKIAGTPKEGAAAKAGLRKGDVILAVDDVEVKNGPHFQMLVSSRLGGDTVQLRVRKNDAEEPEQVGPITLLDAPWSEQKQSKTAELPASFPLPEKPEGR
ncbi:MAG TPA: trypsin-like peptidase domain-containing protein [Planctomycetota bacterium]|nr:trypsin-like peptidase domain-containing protein [Planctomycetota bacterium]